MSSFPQILPWVLVHEGGFVDHPKDPGGATNKGVTQQVYDGFRRRLGRPTQSVRAINAGEVEEIYRAQYWNVVRADELADGLDYAVFDFAVNSGPRRAAKFLQRLLGVEEDGWIGDVTLGALQAVPDKGDLIRRYCLARMKWLKTLRTFKTFGRGWRNRVMGLQDGVQHGDTGVIDRASALHAGREVIAPTAAEEGVGKAEQADRKAAPEALQQLADPKVLTTGAAVLGSLGSLASGSGPIQYAVAGVLVMLAAVFAYKALRGAGQ